MTDSPDGGPVVARDVPSLNKDGSLPKPYTAPDTDDSEAMERRQTYTDRLDELADTPCCGR